MAQAAVGFVGSITLVDSEGSQSTVDYTLTAVDMTTAESAMGDILTALDAVTDAVIKGYRVAHVYANDAFAYPSGVEIEKRATISARLYDTLPVKYVNIFIPAPNQGIFMSSTGPGAKVIDVNDSALQTYLDIFANGNLATVSDGETIIDPTTEGAFSGWKSHRGSRRG